MSSKAKISGSVVAGQPPQKTFEIGNWKFATWPGRLRRVSPPSPTRLRQCGILEVEEAVEVDLGHSPAPVRNPGCTPPVVCGAPPSPPCHHPHPATSEAHRAKARANGLRRRGGYGAPRSQADAAPRGGDSATRQGEWNDTRRGRSPAHTIVRESCAKRGGATPSRRGRSPRRLTAPRTLCPLSRASAQ